MKSKEEFEKSFFFFCKMCKNGGGGVRSSYHFRLGLGLSYRFVLILMCYIFLIKRLLVNKDFKIHITNIKS